MRYDTTSHCINTSTDRLEPNMAISDGASAVAIQSALGDQPVDSGPVSAYAMSPHHITEPDRSQEGQGEEDASVGAQGESIF